jgi:hypothetical protein
MKKWLKFSNSCPSCNKNFGKKLNIKCLGKKYERDCGNCGQKIVSDIGWPSYIIFVFYFQVVVILAMVPLAVALMEGIWIASAGILFLVTILVMPPAMLLHAHHIKACDSEI